MTGKIPDSNQYIMPQHAGTLFRSCFIKSCAKLHKQLIICFLTFDIWIILFRKCRRIEHMLFTYVQGFSQGSGKILTFFFIFVYMIYLPLAFQIRSLYNFLLSNYVKNENNKTFVASNWRSIIDADILLQVRNCLLR